MKDLQDLLKKEKYKKVKFKVSKTNHLLLKASVNGITGNFILDTGASSSCVGLECVWLFKLSALPSDTKAAGAGGTGMATQVSSQNKLTLGRWNNTDFSLVIFDLSHVNQALTEHKAKKVQGIIGADVLIKAKAIIDYHHHYVYLKSDF